MKRTSCIKIHRPFQGIWVPKQIWLDSELTLLEKMFLIEINGLNGKDGCFASNQHFSDFFGVSKGRCSQIINSLHQKKYIKITFQKEGKVIKKRIIRVFNFLKGGIKFSKGGYLENDKGINTNIINKKNIKKNFFDPIKIFLKNSPQEIKKPNIVKAIKQFINYRKEINKPFKTEHAIKMMINKLKNYSQETIISTINLSIEREWVGLFPDHNYNGGDSSKQTKNIQEVIESHLNEEYGGFDEPEIVAKTNKNLKIRTQKWNSYK